MIQKLAQSNGKVLGYAVRDQVTKEDIEMLGSEIKTAIQEHGKIRMLVNYEEMSGFDLSALDEDLRLGRFMDDFERLAVVSDNKLYDWMTSASDAVTDIDIRHFEPGEEKLAWNWLK